jgi:Xaa-Pro aminopeptidase
MAALKIFRELDQFLVHQKKTFNYFSGFSRPGNAGAGCAEREAESWISSTI